ncbi:MAG: TrbI/VirB10 family protein [Candidatus Angelobacter sp.]
MTAGLMTAGLLTMSATAQTSVGASASGSASVTPGQASAGASASQSTQTSGTSANVDGAANAKTSQSNEKKGAEKAPAGSAAAGSNSSAGLNGASGALSSGTTLQAELTKSIDAKKAKSGDEVTARLTQDVKADGKVVMHKGSRLFGHVTEAQARSKENGESRLGVVFDKAVLKDGQEMAFSGVIQALAPPMQGTLSATGDETGNLGIGGGQRQFHGRGTQWRQHGADRRRCRHCKLNARLRHKCGGQHCRLSYKLGHGRSERAS